MKRIKLLCIGVLIIAAIAIRLYIYGFTATCSIGPLSKSVLNSVKFEFSSKIKVTEFKNDTLMALQCGDFIISSNIVENNSVITYVKYLKYDGYSHSIVYIKETECNMTNILRVHIEEYEKAKMWLFNELILYYSEKIGC